MLSVNLRLRLSELRVVERLGIIGAVYRSVAVVSSYVCPIYLLYLINIHWLSVDFDWSRAGHAEGAILSCRMVISPSDVISA